MRTLGIFVAAFVAAAQPPETGRIEREGAEARLIVDQSPRPLASATMALTGQFHLVANVEDPPYSAMSPGTLSLTFHLGPDGQPAGVPALMEKLRDLANAQYPFAYRLDHDRDAWTFVATRTFDPHGQTVEFLPLLDRRITIPLGIRTVAEHAQLMVQALSKQTGTHLGCCQSIIAGVPWGLEKILFGAQDEPAREVLLDLTRATRGRFTWHTACGAGIDWCFISLEVHPAR